jgi:ribosomal protein S6--L-glutamate ligase
MRYVVNMRLRIGADEWLIDVTLTNRERMEMPMLIGREALAGRVLVDAAKSWLGGAPARQKRPAKTPSAKTRVAREPSA